MDGRDGRHAYSYQYGRPDYSDVQLKFVSSPSYYSKSYKTRPAVSPYHYGEAPTQSYSNYASAEALAHYPSTLYRDQIQPLAKPQVSHQLRYPQQQNYRYQVDTNDDGYRYKTVNDYGSDVYVYFQSKAVPGSQRYVSYNYNRPTAYQPYKEKSAPIVESPDYNNNYPSHNGKYTAKQPASNYDRRPYDTDGNYDVNPQIDVRVAPSQSRDYPQNKPNSQYYSSTYPQNRYNDKSQSYNYGYPQNNRQREGFSYSYVTSHPSRYYVPAQPSSAYRYGNVNQKDYNNHNNGYRQPKYVQTYKESNTDYVDNQNYARSREYLTSPISYNIQSQPLTRNYVTAAHTNYNNNYKHSPPQINTYNTSPNNDKYVGESYDDGRQVLPIKAQYSPSRNSYNNNEGNFNFANNGNYHQSQPREQKFTAIPYQGGYNNNYRQSPSYSNYDSGLETQHFGANSYKELGYKNSQHQNDKYSNNNYLNNQAGVNTRPHDALPVNYNVQSQPQKQNYDTDDDDDDEDVIDVRFKENSASRPNVNHPINYSVKNSGESYSYRTPSSQLYYTQYNPSYGGSPSNVPVYFPSSPYRNTKQQVVPSRIRYDSPAIVKPYETDHNRNILREFLHEQRDGYFGYSYDFGRPDSNVAVSVSSSLPSNYLYKRNVGTEVGDSYVSRRNDKVEVKGDLGTTQSSLSDTKNKVASSEPSPSAVTEKKIETSASVKVEDVIDQKEVGTAQSRQISLQGIPESSVGGLYRPPDGPPSTVGKPFVRVRDPSLPDDKGRQEYKLPELTNVDPKAIRPINYEQLFRELYATHPDIHGLINPSKYQPLNVIGLPHKFRYQHPQGNFNGFRPLIYEGNAYLHGPVVDSGVRKGSGHVNDEYKFQRIYDTHPGTDKLVNPEQDGPLNVIGLPHQFRYPHPNGQVNGFRPPEVPTNKYLPGPAIDYIVDKPLLPKVTLPTEIYAATKNNDVSYMYPNGHREQQYSSASSDKRKRLPLARYSQGPVTYVRNPTSVVKPPEPAQTISYNHPMLKTYISKAKLSLSDDADASTKTFIYTRSKFNPAKSN
ncbi:hypothetical protein CHUAL_007704 [Chamberlinius hualienensis]